MAESQGAEAFVEVNDPHVAVRMRRPKTPDEEWSVLLLSDAGVALSAVQGFRALNTRWDGNTAQGYRPVQLPRPRLSSSEAHMQTYFELLNLEDSNAVADKLKAKLKDLGYKLTDERFLV